MTDDDEYRYKVTARWYGFTRPLVPLLLEAAPPLPEGGTFAMDHAVERRERLEQMRAELERDDRITPHEVTFRREYLGHFVLLEDEHAEKADLHGVRPGDLPTHVESARDCDGEGRVEAALEPQADADKAAD